MDDLTPLFLLYIGLVAVNFLISALLWLSSKVVYYAYLSLVWLIPILSLVLVSIAQPYGQLTNLLAYSTIFFFNLGLHQFFEKLLNINFHKMWFVWIYAISLIITIFLDQIPNLPSSILATPIAISHASPLLYASIMTFKKRWKDGSLSVRGFAITLLIAGLHSLDYPLAFMDTDFIKFGFTLGLIMTFALTLFSQGLVVELVSREKTKLELELSYKGILTQNAKLAVIGELASGIAHEVNNPLASMQFLIESTKRQIINSPENAASICIKNFDKIQAEIKHASYIVKSLFEISKEASDEPLQTISLTDTIKSSVILCKEKFKKHGIEFKVELPPQEIYVIARPGQIAQAILNLLTNSFEACQAIPTNKWIYLELQGSQKEAIIRITDNGKGINPNDQDKIYLPFFSTKNEVSGVGLGLTTAKGLVEANGGTLNFLPEDGLTSFVIRLPTKAIAIDINIGA